MAKFRSLGAFTVPVAGVPVRITLPADQIKTVHAFSIQALHTNTGKVFVGDRQAMVKATFVGVLAVIPIPTANLIGSFTSAIANGANAIPIDNLWLDVDTNGEGVLMSILES
jgi:hypothetical protein